MPQSALEIVASPSQFHHLPFSVYQKSSRTSALILLMLLVPALCMVAVPLAFLATAAAPAWGVATDNPAAALQVLVGFGLWTALFILPAKTIIARFGSGRTIRIEGGIVTVRDTALFGSAVWSAPLADFRGVAHHVRATLSGLRHELVLVHGERRRSVLLHAADRIPASTIERASALLRLPEVPARELYERAPRRLGMVTAAVVTRTA